MALEKAELLQVAAIQSVFRVSPEYGEKYKDTTKIIDQRVLDEPEFDQESGVLFGHVRCRVWMKEAGAEVAKVAPDESDFMESLLALEVVYLVAFQISGEHERDALVGFFNRMSPLTTWAYFRAHVANVAGEACIDIPVLPIKKLSYPLDAARGYQQAPAVSEKKNGTK